MALLCGSNLLLLVVANYFLHRDVLYPGFLQAVLWFIVVALCIVYRDMFIPIPESLFTLLLAGVVVFGMGAFVASYNHTASKTRNYVDVTTLPSDKAVVILAIVVILGLFPYLSRISELAASGPSTNSFINLRYNASVNLEETGGIGRVSYFITLSYVLAGIAILKRQGPRAPTISKPLTILFLAIAFVYGLLSSGRGQLLTLLLIALTIPLILRAARPGRTVVILACVGTILFAGVGIALEKGGNIGSTVGENLTTMRESVVTYILGGVPALGSFLKDRGPDVAFGANSFRSVFALFQALGFSTSAAPLVQPYLDVPMPVNVYTIYQPYVLDFGLVGGLLALFAIGFAHGVLYTRATTARPKALWVFLFAVSTLPLSMQAFQDMYFSLLSLWIQYATYGVVFFSLLTDGRRRLAAGRPLHNGLTPSRL